MEQATDVSVTLPLMQVAVVQLLIFQDSPFFLGGTTLTQSRGDGADDDGIKGDVDEVVKGCVVLTGVGTGVVGHE